MCVLTPSSGPRRGATAVVLPSAVATMSASASRKAVASTLQDQLGSVRQQIRVIDRQFTLGDCVA